MRENDTSTVNSQYADQWIKFLRKRNTILNIVCLVMLTVAASTSITAFYYYQLHFISMTQTVNVETDLAFQRSEYEYLLADFEMMRSINDELREKIDFLESDKKALSAKQVNANSQLDVSGKMVGMLKKQVDDLRGENDTMLEAVQEAKALLEQQQRLSTTTLKSQESKSKEEQSKLRKEMAARSTAYKALVKRQIEMQSEIDRLDSLVSSSELKVKTLTNKYNNAQNQYLASQKALSNAYAKESAVEAKTKLANEMLAKESEKPKEKALATGGLEEIKKPVVNKSVKSKDTTFDFDRLQ